MNAAIAYVLLLFTKYLQKNTRWDTAKSVRSNGRKAWEVVCKLQSHTGSNGTVHGGAGEWIWFMPQPYFFPYFLIPDTGGGLVDWLQGHPKRLGKGKGKWWSVYFSVCQCGKKKA